MNVSRAAVIAASVALLGASVRPASGDGAGCVPRGRLAVLLRNHDAVVFERAGRLYGCVFAQGQRRLLGERGGWSPRPAMALKGTTVAWAADELGAEEGSALTNVWVRDLRHTYPRSWSPLLGAIAVLRLTASGATVWTECGTDTATTRLCLRHAKRTGLTEVVTASSGTGERPRRELDEGRLIAPYSLTLSGSTASWRHSGRLRTAPIS